MRSLGLAGFLDQARVEVLFDFERGLVHRVLDVEVVDNLARAVDGVEAVALGVVLDVSEALSRWVPFIRPL